jgi:hypothetical protein
MASTPVRLILGSCATDSRVGLEPRVVSPIFGDCGDCIGGAALLW